MGAAGGAVAGGLQVVQSLGEANARQAQGRYQKRMGEINAWWAEQQAAKSIERGDEAAFRYLQKASEILGKQQTGFAASGIQVGYGSAKEIQKQTREIAQADAQEIRANAFLEAMGYQSEASKFRREGAMGLASAQTEAAQTILAGGLKAYKSYKGIS